MGRDTLTREPEFDYYLSLAELYDTTDLNVPWDWKNERISTIMPSSNETRIGAIAESDFVTQCLTRNFEPHSPTTAMPWDFIVTCPAGSLKVQIKATNVATRPDSYNIATHTGSLKKKCLDKKAIDVVGCYIQPEKLWFIIPIEHIKGQTTRLSTDQTTKSRFQKYRENWSIFYE